VSGPRADLREGRENGFPFCCRWRYAVTETIRPGAVQAIERGLCRTDAGMEYVPCGLRHKGTVRSRIAYGDGEPVLYIEPRS